MPLDSISTRLRYHGGPLIGFVLLTVGHTWPMASNPAGLSLNWNQDAAEITWIVNWVAEWLPRAPTRLLDANIFHPADNALVTCEPMIVTGAMGAPIRALGADAVLTHNLVWLLGFVLSAFCMYLLVEDLTGDRWAGVVAGTLFIFNAHIQSRLPHLMAIHQEWLPLALLAFERLLREPRLRYAVGLGSSVALVSMSSGHVTVYTLIILSVLFLVRAPDWWPSRKQFLTGLGAAVAIAIAVALPVIHPWLGSLPRRDLEMTQRASASLASYVSALSNLHFVWSGRFYDDTRVHFFLGVVPLLLAGVALVAYWRRGGRPRRIALGYGLAAVTGVILSLGPATPVYPVARAIFPPLQAVRASGRLGFVFVVGVAVLAGLGMATVRRGLRVRGRRTLAVSLLLVAMINVEAFHGPLLVEPHRGFPKIYDRVARLPAGTALAEFPIQPGPLHHRNARYMLYSTVHWKPIVNGYATFYPDGYAERAEDLSRFPHALAIRQLSRLEVTHVIVHYRDYRRHDARRIRRILADLPMFAEIASDEGGRTLYRFGGRRSRHE